jgi:hypothetical protein
MDWLNQISGMVQKYAAGVDVDDAGTESEFDQVAQQAPPNVLANGLAEAFRSYRTPAFPDMLSQLFGASNGDQRANVINSLAGALGPGVLASVLGSGGGLSGLASMLGSGAQITPQQAQQISPEALQQLATHAQQQNPGVIDQISEMYANTPSIVKTLGAGALAVALAKIAKDHNLV